MYDWTEHSKARTGVDAENEYGRTRLMQAVERRDSQEVAALLAQGANPDLQAAYMLSNGCVKYAGITALIIAAQKNDLLCAELLLENGADPGGVAYYTDPGMGHYTVEPWDYIISNAMRELIVKYFRIHGAEPQRGEWAVMLGCYPGPRPR